MIGAISDINIKIGSGIYRMLDLYGKTLYAARKVNVFKSYAGGRPIATVQVGDPIGIVRGYVANGYKGAKQAYLIVGPSSNATTVVPYAPENFSESAIESQGVQTALQKSQSDQSDLAPWYIKLTKTILPWAVVGLVGYQLLKKHL